MMTITGTSGFRQTADGLSSGRYRTHGCTEVWTSTAQVPLVPQINPGRVYPGPQLTPAESNSRRAYTIASSRSSCLTAGNAHSMSAGGAQRVH